MKRRAIRKAPKGFRLRRGDLVVRGAYPEQRDFFLMKAGDWPPGFLPGEKSPPPKPGKRSMMNAEAYVDPSRLISSQLFVPYNPSVLVTRKGLGVFDAMMLDAQVKAAMAFKMLAVLAGGWEVVSPDDQEDDWEVTKFVRDMLTHFPGGWNAALKKMLRATQYGYSVLEKVYQERKEGMLEGKIVLDRLVELKQHYIDFETDASGKVEAILQMPAAGHKGDTRFHPLKFVHYVYDRRHENPYGHSDLEAAYMPWWVKDNAYKWFAILLERFGIPPLFAMYDPDEYQGAQLEELKKVVRNIQAATMGIIPRSTAEALEFYSQSLSANNREIYTAAFARFDADIAKSLLQPSLVGFAQEAGSTGPQGGGSLARSNTSWNAFMMVVRELQEDLAANAVNGQVIPQACDLNFPGLKSYPLFKFARLDEEKELELFRLWSDLVKGKIVNRIEDDERHIRKALGMPESDEIRIEDLPEDQKIGLDREKMDKGIDLQREGFDREDARSEIERKEAAKKERFKKIAKNELSEEMRTFAEESGGTWVLMNGHPVCLEDVEGVIDRFAEWDESKHRRHPAGSPQGGEFAPGDVTVKALRGQGRMGRDLINTEWEVYVKGKLVGFFRKKWIAREVAQAIEHGHIKPEGDVGHAFAVWAEENRPELAGRLPEDLAKFAEEEGVWRTIRGRRVFIKKGESVEDALKRSLEQPMSAKEGEAAVEGLLEMAAKMRERAAGMESSKDHLRREDATFVKSDARIVETTAGLIEKGNWKGLRAHLNRMNVTQGLRGQILRQLPARVRKEWGWLATGERAEFADENTEDFADYYEDFAKDDDEDGVWRTVNGRRVFLRKGDSVADAIKRQLDRAAELPIVHEKKFRGEKKWKATVDEMFPDGEFSTKISDDGAVTTTTVRSRGEVVASFEKWSDGLRRGWVWIEGKADDAKLHDAERVGDLHIFAFNPNQPRDPKGTATGGQWTAAGADQVDEAQKALKKLGKGKNVTLDAVFGKGRSLSEDETGIWYDHIEEASPFGPFMPKGLWKEETVNLDDLHFSEKSVSRQGVARMLDERKDLARTAKGEPIYAIRDNLSKSPRLILMDGHHRAVSAHLLGQKTLTLRVVDGLRYKEAVQELL